MWRALGAGLLMAMIAPVIGSFLLMRRMTLIADTLSHIALLGVGIGLLTGQSPLLFTVLVTVAAALLIEWLRQRTKLNADTVLAMILPTGLALSLVLLSVAKGFNSNLLSYLFGSISTVSAAELIPITILGLVTLAALAYFYYPLLFTAFDETGAQVSGLKVRYLNSMLMVLTALTVALSMRVVGALLVSALMVIPSVTGTALGKSFGHSLVASVVVACVSVVVGLFAAFYLNIPAGAAIVLTALGIFALVKLVHTR